MDTIEDAVRKIGSQDKLASLLGVTQGAISQWATGRTNPSPAYVARIYRDLGVDLRYMHPDVFFLHDLPSPVPSEEVPV